jgi:hypothetical protein
MEVKMKININLNEETNEVEVKTDKPINIQELMTIFFTMQLEAMNNVKRKAQDDPSLSEQQKQEIIESLYDNYNAGASNVLYLFAPDEELHPDLTVEAMKEAEDRYMYNKLNRESRREVDKKTHGETKVLRFRPKGE